MDKESTSGSIGAVSFTTGGWRQRGEPAPADTLTEAQWWDCCCDEMAQALKDEWIERGDKVEIVYYGEAWYGAGDRRYPISYCPFCGTAVDGDNE